jgi:prepilin-type N-terminal cleavage/methylation domain-containing protein
MTRPLTDRGFSLIEMMVAMAIASILMLLLVQFVQMATTAVVTGEDSLYRTNDAQAALDILASDLRSLKLISGPVTASGNYKDLQGNTITSPPEILQVYNDSAGINVSQAGNVKPQHATIYPNRLYLLANSSGTDGSGSGFPHLICYRMAWQDALPNDGGNQPILGLYRSFVSQDDTFGASGASSDQAFNKVGIAGLTDLYGKYWSINNLYSGLPPVSDLLVGNVIDFQVYFYDVGSTNPTKALNGPVSGGLLNQYVQSSSQTEASQVDLSANGFLVNQTVIAYSSLVAEVKITVLTNKGVEIMNSGGLAVTDSKLLDKYARTYVRRVPLALQ